MKTIFFTFLLFISCNCFSQYIGVRARYTETKLVDDSPNPPRRQNRLILSFYEVSGTGIYTPVSLSNYDIWVYKEGLQYGSYIGGVLDSSGNNYPGYAWPAPMAVSYYNSYFPNYIDCDPNAATKYTVNGHELDCGFVTVSYWDIDYGTGQSFEAFPAPNVCLPYYIWPNPYAFSPGNVNFTWPVPPTAPYNWYSFACYNSTQQLVIRGVLPMDSSALLVILPVEFANERAVTDNNCHIKLSWSNLTETDINYYEVDRSVNGNPFAPAGYIFSYLNNGSAANYNFTDSAKSIQGAIIYRIKAVEMSNNFFYSTMLRVKTCDQISKSTFTVFPNPALNGKFNFQITNLSRGRYQVSVVNAVGEKLVTKEIIHNGGLLTDFIELPYSPGGMYSLIIRSEDILLSKKIIIKK